MQVACVRVQRSALPGQCIDNVGMAVPNVGHVVENIQVPTAVGVIQPHAFTPHDMNRLGIEQAISSSKQTITPFDHLLRAGFIVRHDGSILAF